VAQRQIGAGDRSCQVRVLPTLPRRRAAWRGRLAELCRDEGILGLEIGGVVVGVAPTPACLRDYGRHYYLQRGALSRLFQDNYRFPSNFIDYCIACRASAESSVVPFTRNRLLRFLRRSGRSD